MGVRVSLVDDAPVLRGALAAGFADDPRTEVVAVAADARELLDSLVLRPVDIALLDVHLHATDGIALVGRIHRLHPEVKIVVLSSIEREPVVRASLHAGASGYLIKRQTMTEIADGVCAVHDGGIVLAPQVASSFLHDVTGPTGERGADPAPTQLGQGELEVLRLVVHGATDLQIARALYVSPRTVQYQLARIRSKAGVHRRTELAHWAHENSLV
jgi:DNA-binding NarL/FixJ family response regulator